MILKGLLPISILLKSRNIFFKYFGALLMQNKLENKFKESKQKESNDQYHFSNSSNYSQSKSTKQ